MESQDVVRRIYEEIFTRGEYDVADDLFAENFVDHVVDPLPNQPLHGPAAVKWYAHFLRGAFPDLTVTCEQVIVDGNIVAARVHWRGTHAHQLGVIAPTGRQVVVLGIDMARMRDGKITEHWGGWYFDSVLRQIGMFPSPEGTPF